MFFIASKALWFLAAPSALLILGALIGAAFSSRRRGQLLAFVCLALLLVIGAAPVGALLIGPLENRFPQPPANQPAPYGIVVLGGAIDDEISRARGQPTFDEGAERLTEVSPKPRFSPAATLRRASSTAAAAVRCSAGRRARRRRVAACSSLWASTRSASRSSRARATRTRTRALQRRSSILRQARPG